MKNLLWIMVMVVSVSITGICQQGKPNKSNKGKPKTNDVSGLYEPYETGKCANNPDSLYSRQKTLEQFAEILNKSVFGQKKTDFEFDVKDERPGRFTVYDLSEPPNKGIPLGKCINFLNNHVYHFSPMEKRYSFSHIVILENGDLKVFKSINCKGKGDSIEDVISYLSEKLREDKNKVTILSRVRNYRKYGIYTTVDTPILKCNDGSVGPALIRLRFTAKERDIETNLDYFLARYYSSVQGRFTSPDEFSGGPDELYNFTADASANPTFYANILSPQSLNKYQYSFNNPLRYVDPDGRDGAEAQIADGTRALQGAAIHAGVTLMRDGQLRSQYTAAAKGATSAEREVLKAATREKMSTFSRELSKLADKSRAGQSANWTAESAKRTSPFWNKVGVVSEGTGRAAMATAVVFSVVAIATAEPGHRGEAVATEVGAWTGAYLGGVGGAKVGAVIGTIFEPDSGTVAGAAVGGLVGGAGGQLGAVK